MSCCRSVGTHDSRLKEISLANITSIIKPLHSSRRDPELGCMPVAPTQLVDNEDVGRPVSEAETRLLYAVAVIDSRGHEIHIHC